MTPGHELDLAPALSVNRRSPQQWCLNRRLPLQLTKDINRQFPSSQNPTAFLLPASKIHESMSVQGKKECPTINKPKNKEEYGFLVNKVTSRIKIVRFEKETVNSNTMVKQYCIYQVGYTYFQIEYSLQSSDLTNKVEENYSCSIEYLKFSGGQENMICHAITAPQSALDCNSLNMVQRCQLTQPAI
ncbi:hypothetical protein SAY86_008753 [Trapa natans]|uniref:Uncharacterized protein n=1 Tax=Trapa natans TaxID=22666 RepID=A0AAN7KHP7_TRANT|nr:hypothetical protein SAY86_008753 [Trapa natans]